MAARWPVIRDLPLLEGTPRHTPGAAIALKKPTFLFRDDWRRCTDSERYPLNLMLFAGMPEAEWEDYYYTSVDEIASPDKALFVWARSTSTG